MNYAQLKNYCWIIIADEFFVSVECSCQNITAGELTCLFSMEEIVLRIIVGDLHSIEILLVSKI
jgi:hypothetical protein